MKKDTRPSAYYTGPVTDHFDGIRFFNPWNPRGKKGFIDFLKWRADKNRSIWPKMIENIAKPPIPEQSQKARATFIGHATILIQLNGLNILTDPVFSFRASPYSKAGPRRVRQPFVRIDQLPRIDYVFVSHNHYDHMDTASLRALAQKFNPTFITPLGNIRHIKPWIGSDPIVSLDWHETFDLGGAKLSLTPAQHWSRRGFTDVNRDLWGGAFIKDETGQSVYFTGDSGFDKGLFEDIFRRHGAPDIALLPIGAYEPRWFMKYAHMNPADAVEVHKILQARKSMGFHFGTFQMTNEGIEDPVRDLNLALIHENIAQTDFIAPFPGDFVENS